jgi:hypothetical protein
MSGPTGSPARRPRSSSRGLRTPAGLGSPDSGRLSDPRARPQLVTTPRTSQSRARRLEALRQLAEAQAGVATDSQLRALDWGPYHVQHEIEVGRWTRVAPHVVALQNGELVREQVAWTGILHAGCGAVLSHLTACVEAGLDHWREDRIEVLVPKSSNVQRLPGIQFHETRRPYAGWRHPTASPPRLRLEAAALLAAERRAQAMQAVGLLAACVQQRLSTAERLLVASREISKLRYGKLLRAALGDIAGGAQSFAEIEIGVLCRAAGLAPPRRQQIRRDRTGRRRYLDCEWELPDGRILVLEIDGAFHLRTDHWWQDMARERGVVISGRIVLRCASIEIRLTPDAIMSDLRAAGVPSLFVSAA